MRHLSEQEFLKCARKGNLVPVYKEIFGDLETPVSAYMKFALKSKYSFLLESVEGGEKLARYSFLARDPELVLRTQGREAEVIRFGRLGPRSEKCTFEHTPLELVRKLISGYKFVNIAPLPRFCGGLVGYIGYDTVRFFEKLPEVAQDDLKLPDLVLMMAKDIVIFDHLHHTIQVVSCVEVGKSEGRKQLLAKYRTAMARVNKMIQELGRPLQLSCRQVTGRPVKLKVRSNCTRARYEEMVRKAQEEIRAGEIIQVVLSQRFEVDVKTDPVTLYRTLRTLNPSPYMYLLNLDGIQVVGSSPELLIRCEQGIVETRPIAGTRPRGKNPEEDAALEKELLADPKELAEHVMLVDLGRNDLGRVCRQGTVKVTELMAIERYSHVMHIVSNVRGELRPEHDAIAALQATFPAGTLSGAPKIRAMEIIDSLESRRRGPYGGCVGYFSFSQDLDTCITIRTIVLKGKKAYIQAGAGIVADSDPAREYAETVNKAKAQIGALELAHRR
ncbi:MAG: anthranilate synthase component I [Candidatus Omnitrophica bacterium]|nr:anthranilate synthase component I [Candidatus Omnitrophota bacterium]